MLFGTSVPSEVVIFRFALLAFHKALWEQPRDPLVVAVFSLAVHNGGDLSEALSIARRINKQHDISFDELLEPKYMKSNELLGEVIDLADSVGRSLTHMTDAYFVSQAMAKYPKAPQSDLVSTSAFLGPSLFFCFISFYFLGSYFG